MHTWIRTASGGQFDPYAPDVRAVNVYDIAHALSNICRFAGHTRRFYSVAQHCVNVSLRCSDARYGLLHDASEAYLDDIRAPLKRSDAFMQYRTLERSVQRVVYERFGLDATLEPSDLHDMDERECAREMQELMPCLDLPPDPQHSEITALGPFEAERLFLERFATLFPTYELSQADEQAFPPSRPSWDETWMQMARTVSQRSYDPRLRVGAVIVADDNTTLLSLGYNGNHSRGPNVPDSLVPGASGFIHAELNALLKLDFHAYHRKLLYVTHSPCVACAKCIVNAGIAEVVYESEYRDASGIELLRGAGVSVRKFRLL
jgi:deoxycytidylate deaminase